SLRRRVRRSRRSRRKSPPGRSRPARTSWRRAVAAPRARGARAAPSRPLRRAASPAPRRAADRERWSVRSSLRQLLLLAAVAEHAAQRQQRVVGLLAHDPLRQLDLRGEPVAVAADFDIRHHRQAAAAELDRAPVLPALLTLGARVG